MTEIAGAENQTVEAASDRPSFFNKIYTALRFPYRNDLLFSLVFFGSLFLPLTTFSYMSDGYETPKLTLWLVICGFAMLVVLKKGFPTFPKIPAVLLTIFSIYSILVTVFSLDPINSIVGLNTRFTSGLLFYGLWVSWIVIVYKSLDRDKLLFLFKTVSLSGLLVAVLGLLQHQGIAFYSGVAANTRSLAPSFLGNPNFSSMYLVAIVPIALFGFYQAQQLTSRYFFGVSSLLMIWAIMAFSSRGAILGVAAALVVYAAMYLWKNKNWFSLLSIVVVAVISLLLFVGFFSVNRPGTITNTLALTDNTLAFRFFAWADTAEIIQQYPVFGTGHGNFYIGFKALGDSALASGERFDDAHNLFIHLAATAGIPFALLFVLILAWAIACGIMVWKDSDDSNYRNAAAALVAGLVGWMVVTSFNPVTVACWTLLAFLVAALFFVRYGMQAGNQQKLLSHLVVKIITGLAAILFIIYGLSLFTSDTLNFQALKAYRSHDYSKAEKLFRSAVYINPNNTGALSYWAAARIKQNKDHAESAKIVSFMVSLHPGASGMWQTADTLYYMLYKQSGEQVYKDKTYEAMHMAEKLEPNFANVLGHQAYIYFKFKDFEIARRYVNNTLVRGNDQFYSWLLLAQLYKEAGMKEQMLFAMQKAIALQPDILLFKAFYQHAATVADLNTLTIPINFAEPDMQ